MKEHQSNLIIVFCYINHSWFINFNKFGLIVVELNLIYQTNYLYIIKTKYILYSNMFSQVFLKNYLAQLALTYFDVLYKMAFYNFICCSCNILINDYFDF